MDVLSLMKGSRAYGVILLCISLLACDESKPISPDPVVVKQKALSHTVLWEHLEGWEQDETQQAWSALLKNCTKVDKQLAWKDICHKAKIMPEINKNTTKKFFQDNFTIQALKKTNGGNKGVMTGYYEPLLQGSYQRTERFKYPVYKTPKQMLIVDLASLYPELEGRRVRGKLEGNRVVPFDDRKVIDGEKQPLAGQELLWVDNYIDLFFLHIQGSGRVQLPDGKIVGVGYANQNGHPYVSIGKYLIDKGWAERKGMSMFTLKDWLRNNPEKAQEVLFANPSYVFFDLREDAESGAVGSLNVPLTPERSIAIDPKTIPLGTALWIDSKYPDGTPLRKLVFAQDTGGAIKGELRADFFFGTGKQAEQWAGTMKQNVKFYRLMPKRIENQH